MKTAPTDDALTDLHYAIARAARNGASYQWIAGVLAGSLVAETTTADARAAAIDALTRPPVTPVGQRAA